MKRSKGRAYILVTCSLVVLMAVHIFICDYVANYLKMLKIKTICLHALAYRSGAWAKLSRCSSSVPFVVVTEAAPLGLENLRWSHTHVWGLGLAGHPYFFYEASLSSRIAKTSLHCGWVPRAKVEAARPL